MKHTPGPLLFDHDDIPACAACLDHWFTARPRGVHLRNYLIAYHDQHRQTGH